MVAVDPDAGGTGIYRRDVNGHVLSFENFDNVSMTDRETKSQWDKATGRRADDRREPYVLPLHPFVLVRLDGLLP